VSDRLTDEQVLKRVIIAKQHNRWLDQQISHLERELKSHKGLKDTISEQERELMVEIRERGLIKEFRELIYANNLQIGL
jgi:uncharacterized protein YydD (DUF2326 family)